MTRTLAALGIFSLALTILGFWYHPALGLFMLGGMVMLGISIWNGGQKMLALYRAREGEDFSTFAQQFPDVSQSILHAVYTTVQSACSSDDHPLPLHPTDHLIDDLMLDLEELFVEVMPKIITELGFGSPEGLDDLRVAGLVQHFAAAKAQR